MNLIRYDLERFDHYPVWFNAWHHQEEEHLLAALLANVREQAIPPWWVPSGIRFRLGLLKSRWSQYWLPVVLMMAALAIVSGYFEADTNRVQPLQVSANTIVTQLNASLGESTASGSGEKAAASSAAEKAEPPAGVSPIATHTGLVFWLIALGGLIGTFARAIQAFGVTPSTLIATVSAGARVRDLDNRTSFRYKFAREFSEVTAALAPKTMTILIDDLDRCRPEQVMQVLEAVNFLTSSGECFVVMGMSMDVVQAFVAHGLGDVADQLDGGSGNDPAAARMLFAQRYLEKLINIEAPVPTLESSQAESLLLPTEAEMVESAARRRREQLMASLRQGATTFIAVPALIVSLFFAAERWFPPSAPVPVAVPSHAAAPVSAAPMRESGVHSPPAKRPGRFTAFDRNDFEPGERTRMPALLGVGILTLCAGTLLWRGLRPVAFAPESEDSDPFKKAVKTWEPLVYNHADTPRALKRFMNRVRFYAMRQRQYGQQPPKPPMLRWSSAPSTNADVPNPVPTIPEDVLVAFASLEHAYPGLFHESTSVAALLDRIDAAELPASDIPDRQILERFWDRYLELCGKVRVR